MFDLKNKVSIDTNRSKQSSTYVKEEQEYLKRSYQNYNEMDSKMGNDIKNNSNNVQFGGKVKQNPIISSTNNNVNNNNTNIAQNSKNQGLSTSNKVNNKTTNSVNQINNSHIGNAHV